MVKIFMWTIIILILIGFLITNVNNLDLSEKEDQIKFVQQYGQWVYKSVINIKAVVGFVVKQDWSINDDKNETE